MPAAFFHSPAYLAQAAVGSQAANEKAIQEAVTKIVAQFPGPGAA